MVRLLSFYGRVAGYFLVLAFCFIILNDSAVLPWHWMEKTWYILLPLSGLVCGFVYGKRFSLRGGAVFAAFLFLLPLYLAANWNRLPFFAQMANPYHLAAFFFLAAFGEAFFRTNGHLQAKKAFKIIAAYGIIKSKRKIQTREDQSYGEFGPEGDRGGSPGGGPDDHSDRKQ